MVLKILVFFFCICNGDIILNFMFGSFVVFFKELILFNWKVSEMEFIFKLEKKLVFYIVLFFFFKFVFEMGI